jgi:hypothetical protein
MSKHTVIIDKSFNVAKDIGITFFDSFILAGDFGGDGGEFPDQDERNDKETFDPFYEFISTM